MDLVLEADRIPAAGESYFGRQYHTIPGGKGANQATAASRLGAAVAFCGRVGDDPNGKRLTESLAESKIDVSGVRLDDSHPTGLAVIIVEPNGENRILVYSGANMEIRVDEVREKLGPDYDAVMMNFEIPDEVVIAVSESAKKHSIPVIIDAGPARPFDLESLAGVGVLSPNETEAKALTGITLDSEDAVEEAARVLWKRSGARVVLIKLGEHGSLAFDGSSFITARAFPVKAIDTTAAGDAYTAGFAVSYLATGNLETAMRYGSAAGAIAVTRLGAQPSLPTADETEAFLRDVLK